MGELIKISDLATHDVLFSKPFVYSILPMYSSIKGKRQIIL